MALGRLGRIRKRRVPWHLLCHRPLAKRELREAGHFEVPDWGGAIVTQSTSVPELSGMQEGTPLTLWNAPDEASLALAVGVLGGAWLLLAGFPREAQRLKWAWARPRNLTTRNASETPQTMGVVLNHALGMFGLWTGLILAFQNAPQSLPWWSALAWMASGLGLSLIHI